MSQITTFSRASGPGSGTVVSVTGGHDINITGNPAVNPTVNLNNAITLGDLVDITGSDAITAVTGDITLSAGNINLTTSTATGQSGIVTVNGINWINTFGTDNIFIGYNAGNLTLTSAIRNVGIGGGTLAALTTGDENVAIGYLAAPSITSAFGNVAIGSDSVMASNQTSSGNTAIGDNTLSSLVSGSGANVVIGSGAGVGIVSGQGNVLLGVAAGESLTTNDSFNIFLGDVSGTAGDNNTIRIGDLGRHTSCYIQGIATVVTSNTQFVTIDTTSGQMGSSAGPGGGITTINGDSSFVTGATVTLTGGTSGAVFTGNGTTTMTESFLFLELPNANAGGTQGYISFNGVKYVHNGGTNNNSLFLGPSSGNFTETGGSNFCLGNANQTALTTGTQNFSGGVAALNALTEGAGNVAVGAASLSALTTGSLNTAVGYLSGSAYTTTEGSNVLLTNSGVIGDANTIRIGTEGNGGGQQDKCFIAGIANVATSNSEMVTIDTTTGQLGSTTIPGGGFTWTVETVNLTMVVNHGYIANKSGLLTLTLPTTSAIGDTIEVTGMNTAVGWRIAQNASQIIHYGIFDTQTGVAGYLESTMIYDSIRIVCNVANLEWIVTPGSVGNITVN